MGARAILNAAYKAGVVPEHLRGRTQHKTLQARLSEDILQHRECSLFYRTRPGQFALTEFIEDPNYPAKWKTPFPARRRTRELKRLDSLAVKSAVAIAMQDETISLNDFLNRAGAPEAIKSMHPNEMKERGYCAVWTFSVVRKGERVLSYRLGRYRDHRDAFANKQSIGFPGPLAASDASLFSTDPLGAMDCATTVLLQDLDLSLAAFDGPHANRPKVEYVTAMTGMDDALDIVIILSWNSPEWFEPTTRRLSLNNPNWFCYQGRQNDMSDFEPWSAEVLCWLSNKYSREDFGTATNY